MIPLFKVVSLVIRLFTRPLSNYLKNSLKNKHDHHPFVKAKILDLGQFYHRIQIKIQRRLMNMSSADNYIKPLPDDKALESGAEFVGEILAYGTLLIWGIYEIDKFSEDAKAKENKQNQVIADIHARIQGLDTKHQEILKIIEKEQEKKQSLVDEATDTSED